MGASLTFLDKPITDIEYATGHSDALKTKFVAAEMQGWRLNMVSIYDIILICVFVLWTIGRCTSFRSQFRQTAGALRRIRWPWRS